MARRFGFVTQTVSAKALVDRALQHFEAETHPEGERPEVSGFSFGERTEPVTWFFERLGRTVEFVDNRRRTGVRVKIPKMKDVFDEHHGRLPAQGERGPPGFFINFIHYYTRYNLTEILDANLPTFLTENDDLRAVIQNPHVELGAEYAERLRPINEIIEATPNFDFSPESGAVIRYGVLERPLSTDDMIRFFDVLTDAQQQVLLPFLRRDIASFTLGTWIEENRPTGVTWRTPRDLRGYFRVRLRFLADFYDTMFWESVVSPLEPIRRFLPPGTLPPRQGAAGDGENPGVGLGDVPVVRDDPRVDPARFDFYTNVLGCRAVVEPAERFMNGNYVAFLLRAASGLRVAILDRFSISSKRSISLTTNRAKIA